MAADYAKRGALESTIANGYPNRFPSVDMGPNQAKIKTAEEL